MGMYSYHSQENILNTKYYQKTNVLIRLCMKLVQIYKSEHVKRKECMFLHLLLCINIYHRTLN